MIKIDKDFAKAEICRDWCPRWNECPMFYECKKIQKIGDLIEDLCDDNTDFGVE